NTLHIIDGGHVVRNQFTYNGKPLKLFFPVLSLSPDRESLITIAPAEQIDPKWKTYQPRFGYEEFRIDAANKLETDPENAWRASQYVDINLRTGTVVPILAAPAGRSVFQVFAPTKAIWSRDSRRAL